MFILLCKVVWENPPVNNCDCVLKVPKAPAKGTNPFLLMREVRQVNLKPCWYPWHYSVVVLSLQAWERWNWLARLRWSSCWMWCLSRICRSSLKGSRESCSRSCMVWILRHCFLIFFELAGQDQFRTCSYYYGRHARYHLHNYLESTLRDLTSLDAQTLTSPKTNHLLLSQSPTHSQNFMEIQQYFLSNLADKHLPRKLWSDQICVTIQCSVETCTNE